MAAPTPPQWDRVVKTEAVWLAKPEIFIIRPLAEGRWPVPTRWRPPPTPGSEPIGPAGSSSQHAHPKPRVCAPGRPRQRLRPKGHGTRKALDPQPSTFQRTFLVGFSDSAPNNEIPVSHKNKPKITCKEHLVQPPLQAFLHLRDT